MQNKCLNFPGKKQCSKRKGFIGSKVFLVCPFQLIGFAIDRDNCLDTLVMSQEILSCQALEHIELEEMAERWTGSFPRQWKNTGANIGSAFPLSSRL